MNLLKTKFEGLYVLETNNFEDNRGSFQKLFNFDFFEANELDSNFKEFYYSISKKNVIRGMHFQTPPHDHHKLVYVSCGKILDVVLDLRKEQPTYGQYFSIKLNEKDAKYLYIPKGMAHGFLSLQEDTIVNYAQTSCYSKDNDCGILYNSFGLNWGIDIPIVSDRDNSFIKFDKFESPF